MYRIDMYPATGWWLCSGQKRRRVLRLEERRFVRNIHGRNESSFLTRTVERSEILFRGGGAAPRGSLMATHRFPNNTH